MHTHSITIFNPIFYDLGFKFEQTMLGLERLQSAILKAYPTWSIIEQNYSFEAYNFSFLSLHLPSVKFNLESTSMTIGGVNIDIDLALSLRMNATICFEYQFRIHHPEAFDLEYVVTELQTLVNVAYRKYLQDINAYKNAMTRLDLPSLDTVPAIFENGAIVRELKRLLVDETGCCENDFVYPYQHGRLLYFIDANSHAMRQVLLTDEFCTKANIICDGSVYLDSWKTVHMGSEQHRQIFMDLYLDNLSKFYQCQIWVFQCEHMLNQIDEKLQNQELSFEEVNSQALEIEMFYFSANRQMINFNNLSIPYKNDDFVELSKAIIDALKLQQHIEQTYTHLDAVKEHINIAKLQTESRTERHTKLLKLLMALNLSAGIASLIPSSLDGDIEKLNSSILPPMVWVTFALIAGLILYLETRETKK